MLRSCCLCAALLVSLAPVPAAADPLPRPDLIATPGERALLPELAEVMTAAGQEPAAVAARLDSLLARLPSPTPLRGFVQFLRASILDARQRLRDAQDAVDESVRLLPAYSAPLMLGAEFAADADHPEDAAALLIRASRIDPELVRRIPNFSLENILRRLPQDSGRRTRLAVIERLFEIGWRGEGPAVRSQYARFLIDHRLEQGDIAGARALLPQIVRPQDARAMLMQKRYEPIWPDIESWAGPQAQTLWAIYLNDTRESWTASHDLGRGRDYVGALSAAQRWNDIVTEFLPLFAHPDHDADYDLQWIAPTVATALAHLGRWEEADALFARALQVWPLGGDANALNLIANRGLLRIGHGDFAGAAADMRASVEDAAHRGGEVSVTALLPMHRELACALHRLHRDNEAILSATFVFNANNADTSASLRLCYDQIDGAREAVLAGLASDEQRDDVIHFLDDEEPALPSAYDRELHRQIAALRSDARVVAAVQAHGRLLPYPLAPDASTSHGTRE